MVRADRPRGHLAAIYQPQRIKVEMPNPATHYSP
jgi:hypothetical protein